MRFEQADVWLSQEAETSKEQTWQLASKFSQRRSSPSRWGALLLAVALSGSSPLVAVTQNCSMWYGSDGVVLNTQGVNNVWIQVTTQQVPCEINRVWGSQMRLLQTKQSRTIRFISHPDNFVGWILPRLFCREKILLTLCCTMELFLSGLSNVAMALTELGWTDLGEAPTFFSTT